MVFWRKLMALSQPTTFNEEWNDERINSYLNRQPPVGESADFNVLYVAYKHMRPSDYERFLIAFTAQGRNLQATNVEGLTIQQLISQHPSSAEFLTVLANFS